MEQDEKEQQARIALLDYFGSLMRHWATVVLTTAVVFYAIIQARKMVNNEFLFTIALTMTVAAGAYAFLRILTHGKYCELALNPDVKPLNKGTYVTGMLHGMHRSLRMDNKLKYLECFGDLWGFACCLFIAGCVWIDLALFWGLVHAAFWSGLPVILATVACAGFALSRLLARDLETYKDEKRRLFL